MAKKVRRKVKKIIDGDSIMEFPNSISIMRTSGAIECIDQWKAGGSIVGIVGPLVYWRSTWDNICIRAERTSLDDELYSEHYNSWGINHYEI